MLTPVQIRRATTDDWAAAKQLRLRALQDAPMAFGSTYAREVAFEDATWRDRMSTGAQFLAAEGTDLVGTVTAIEDPERPGTLLLVAMYVIRSARGTGVADRLIDAVLDHARESKARQVELHVVETNTTARRLYERHDFAPTGRTMGLAHTPSVPELVLVHELSTDSVADHGNVGPAD